MGLDSRERRRKYIGLKGRATPGPAAVLGARLESVVRIQRRSTAHAPRCHFSGYSQLVHEDTACWGAGPGSRRVRRAARWHWS